MSLCELAKCRRVVTAVLAVAACAGLAGAAHAHPHVWATVRSEIILDANRQITGVRHAWTFDEFYSAMAVQGLDTNGDGVFSAEELKPLAEVNIKSLKDFDYFTFVHIGDADNLPLKPPENYSLDYDKSLLTLHFTLPLEKPLDTHGQEVQVDVYDPSFFVAFGFATEAPVKLSGAAIKGCTAEVKKPDPELGGGCEGAERSLFQPAWAEQQFRLAIRADGDGQMQRRSVHRRRHVRLAGRLAVSAHSFCLWRSPPPTRRSKPLNPFAAEMAPAESAPAAPPSAFAAPSAAQQSAGAFGGIFGWVLRTQQSMQRELATGVKSLKGDNAFAGAVMLAALSFLYGVVHAIGPGHGKMVISSYVVANEETVRRGVVISFIAAGLQALTAVALVGILAFALNASGLQINAWSNQLEMVSYALIALVGAWLLATQLIAIFRRWQESRAAEAHASHAGHDHTHGEHGHHHHHHHGHAHHHDHEEGEACRHIVDARELAGPFSWRKVLAVVFSVGIRPCTGAILVLIFALTQGVFWAGVAATFAMAIGTAITVAVLATLALGSRELALKLGGRSGAFADTVWTICTLGGSALILLFGATLFAASLGPARPF